MHACIRRDLRNKRTKYESVTSRKDRDYPRKLARTDTLISNQTQPALNRLAHPRVQALQSEVDVTFDVNSVC